MAESANTWPKLHNATWPGVVGKGSSDGEPIIPLDALLELTSSADVDGVKIAHIRQSTTGRGSEIEHYV